MSRAKWAANRLIDDLGIREPDDLKYLKEIAWQRNILVQEGDLEGAEARITIGRVKSIITVSSRISNPYRKRFSIVHELGHAELHRNLNFMSICTIEDISEVKNDKQIEQEASEFAAEFLLPERFFKPLCNKEEPSLDYIKQLADKFHVSLTSTSIRFANYCDEPVAIVYSRDRRIEWVQCSESFKEEGFYIEWRKNIPAINTTKPKKVSADLWLDSRNLNRHSQILEHSLELRAYNAALTLLWMEPDEDYSDW